LYDIIQILFILYLYYIRCCLSSAVFKTILRFFYTIIILFFAQQHDLL